MDEEARKRRAEEELALRDKYEQWLRIGLHFNTAGLIIMALVFSISIAGMILDAPGWGTKPIGASVIAIIAVSWIVDSLIRYYRKQLRKRFGVEP